MGLKLFRRGPVKRVGEEVESWVKEKGSAGGRHLSRAAGEVRRLPPCPLQDARGGEAGVRFYGPSKNDGARQHAWRPNPSGPPRQRGRFGVYTKSGTTPR